MRETRVASETSVARKRSRTPKERDEAIRTG